jgi:hypothetical protein
MSFLHRHDDDGPTAEARPADADAALSSLAEEVSRLRRTILRHGHAQELFQARVEEAIERLPENRGTEDAPRGSTGSTGSTRSADSAGSAGGPASGESSPSGLSEPQVRALVELDGALLQLRRLAGEETPAVPGGSAPEDLPRSVREGLSLLQLRVRNLQHSMGLEAIPAAGRPFDDRWHRACGVVERRDLPDRAVVEEILPGYRLGERLLRAAQVVVNRRPEPEDGPPVPDGPDGPEGQNGQDE